MKSATFHIEKWPRHFMSLNYWTAESKFQDLSLVYELLFWSTCLCPLVQNLLTHESTQWWRENHIIKQWGNVRLHTHMSRQRWRKDGMERVDEAWMEREGTGSWGWRRLADILRGSQGHIDHQLTCLTAQLHPATVLQADGKRKSRIFTCRERERVRYRLNTNGF